MNTYRVYVLNTTVALAPTVHVVYVSTEKYDGAWKTARGVVRADEAYKAKALFLDPELKEKAPAFASDCSVVKIDDIRPRNVKLDKTALQAIIADPKATPDEKLKALTTLLA